MRLVRTINIFLLVVCFFLAGTTARSAKLVNCIVAVVNGEVITMHELNEQLERSKLINRNDIRSNMQSPEDRQQMKKNILQSMINNILLEQEAKRLQIDVSDVEVENYLQQMKQERDITNEELQRELAKRGMTIEEFKDTLRKEIKKNRLISSMVRQKVVVPQSEIEAYYENHKEEFSRAKAFHLRLILHPDRRTMTGIKEKIRNDELTFAQAASRFSKGPGASEGGDLGELKWKDLGTKWKEAVKDLEPGEMSDIFRFRSQYGLLFLESLQEGGQAPLKSVREEVRQKIYRSKLQERFKEYLSQLRSKAVLDIRL